MPFKGIYPLHFEKVKKNMLEQKKAPRSIEYLVVVSSMGCDSEMLYYYIIVLTEFIHKNGRLHLAAFSCWVSEKLPLCL